jgi:hypothetical protein
MSDSGLEISGSEYSADLMFTGNKVPPPPTERTSAEIEQELKEVKALFKDLEKGFGKTTLASFPTLSAFESAKAQAYTLINETLPAELKERKDWDKKYRVKVGGLFGTGVNEYTVLSADEVYQYQQLYQAATNPNDPELKAYDSAVKAVNDLRNKINTPGSKESKLSPMDQQLLIAAELKKVQSFVTPRVIELRSQNIPLEVDKSGRTLRSTSFALVGQIDPQINRAVNEGVRIAERVYGTRKPTATLYGQPAELTTVRNQQQTAQLTEFMDRANSLLTATPAQAAQFTPSTTTRAGTDYQVSPYGAMPTTVSGGRQSNVPATTAKAPATGTTRPAVAPAVVNGVRTPASSYMAGQVAPTVIPTPGAGVGGGAGGTGGGAGRVGAGGTIGGGTAETAKFKVGDWQAVLQDQYPGYSKDWIAANATTHFGQDFINLMVEASKPNGRYLGLTTEASVNAFKKDLKQTNYWRTTESTAKRFDESIDVDRQRLINNKKLEIANAYGDVSFDDATLTQLATNAARLGLTGLGLQQAVYSGALKPGAGGVRTALAGRVLEGADADRIRSIGRAWNTKITDGQVQAILTGQPDPATGLVLTEDGLREQLQAKWKGAMPHLRDQFDAGLTLDQIGSSYRTYASQLLETPEDQINMFDGPYLQAFDNGQGSQLSLSQWVEKVKTDPKFGWQYTKQANQQATDIGLTLARAFGKVG